MRSVSTADQPINQKNHRKSSRLRFLIPLALVLTVAAIACGGSSQSIIGDEKPSSRDPAPDFSFTMFLGQDGVGGQEVKPHRLIGDNTNGLNFCAGRSSPFAQLMWPDTMV